jgi:flavorubredoxin
MTKIIIVYDSNTGNTQKMAESIADGAKSISGVDVLLKKVGEPFSLSLLLSDADAVILGSPAHYAFATPEMRDFLSCIQGQILDGNFQAEGTLGAVFGSYGWDGAKSVERFALEMQKIGFKMHSTVLAKASLLPQPQLKEKVLQDCYEFGKSIAEQLTK